MKRSTLIKGCAPLLIAATAFAQDATWTGSESNLWNDADNWNPASIPTGIASFGSSATPRTINLAAPTAVEKLRLNSGTTEQVNTIGFTGSALTISGQETGAGTRPLTIGSNVNATFNQVVTFSQTGGQYPMMDIAGNTVNTEVTFAAGINGNPLVTNFLFGSVSRSVVSAKVNIMGTISNIARIEWKTANSILNLSAASSVTDRTLLFHDNIHLQLGHDQALGTGILDINKATNGNTDPLYTLTLEAIGGNRSYSNELIFNTGGGSGGPGGNPGLIVITGQYNLTFSGLTRVNRPTILEIHEGIRFTLAGEVTSNTENRFLRKTGAGTLVFSGSSARPSSNIEVRAGTVLVNGTVTQYSSSAGHDVMVSETGILGGTGVINRFVTFETGGTLSPGDPLVDGGIGSLTIGTATVSRSLTLAPGSAMAFDLLSADEHDSVMIHGNLTLAGTLNLMDRGLNEAADFRLFQYTGTLTNQGLTLGTVPEGWAFAVDLSTENEVWLRMTAIPEPGTHALLLGGVALAALAFLRGKPAR